MCIVLRKIRYEIKGVVELIFRIKYCLRRDKKEIDKSLKG